MVDVDNTPCQDAVAHWAKVAPDRTALIYTNKDWKVRNGELLNQTVEPSEWKRMSYKTFYENVIRLRNALYRAGVPMPSNKRQYRVVFLYQTPCRIQFIIFVVALQAAGCDVCFAPPTAFGGLRSFCQNMLGTEPDAIICTRLVRRLFQVLATTVKTPKREKRVHLLDAAKLLKALSDTTTPLGKDDAPNGDEATMDTIMATLFSGGTTGPPTPLRIPHRMQNFQLAVYTKTLQERIGVDILNSETASNKDGPYKSCHVYFNYIILDLMLGGTAVLQPMGIAEPAETVCPVTLKNLIQHFGAQSTSTSPALWKRIRETCPKGSLQSLKLAFTGGGETHASFARSICELIAPVKEGDDKMEQDEATLRECGFYRAFGATQCLPMAGATAKMVLEDEDKWNLCAVGGGVLLGYSADGLEISVDKKTWEDKGGISELNIPNVGKVELGELNVVGKAITPSEKTIDSEDPPTRHFGSGDVIYIDPETKYVYFMGRASQSVDCGKGLGLVPPAAVETLCLEWNAVPRCALVAGPKIGETKPPLLVIHFHDKDSDLSAVSEKIRTALKGSAWSGLLDVGLRMVVYPKKWPVDERHNSKTNRFYLRDWASKLNSKKFVTV